MASSREYGLDAEVRESKKSTRFEVEEPEGRGRGRGEGRDRGYGLEAELDRRVEGRGSGSRSGGGYGLEAELEGAAGGVRGSTARSSGGRPSELTLPPPARTPDSATASHSLTAARNRRNAQGHPTTPSSNGRYALPVAETVTLTNTTYASSVLLQQLLYYNCFFSVCWFVAFVYQLADKYGTGDSIKDPDVVRIIMTVLWIPAEPFRLWSGYSGNLGESVPMLIMFMLVTLFPQAPIMFFFILAAKGRTPFDQALSTAMAAMLVTELAVAVYAVRKLIISQEQKFYLEDFEAARQSRGGGGAPNTQA